MRDQAPAHPYRAEGGFSLAEMAVTLLLMSFLVAWTLAVSNDVVARWRLERTVNDVAASLLAARTKAVLDGAETAMDFDVTRGRYTVVGQVFADTSTSLTPGTDGSLRRVSELRGGISFVRPDASQNSRPVTFTAPGAATNDATAVFSTRGLLRSTTLPAYVFLGDPVRRQYRRVVVNLLGAITVERWTGTRWE